MGREKASDENLSEVALQTTLVLPIQHRNYLVQYLPLRL